MSSDLYGRFRKLWLPVAKAWFFGEKTRNWGQSQQKINNCNSFYGRQMIQPYLETRPNSWGRLEARFLIFASVSKWQPCELDSWFYKQIDSHRLQLEHHNFAVRCISVSTPFSLRTPMADFENCGCQIKNYVFYLTNEVPYWTSLFIELLTWNWM